MRDRRQQPQQKTSQFAEQAPTVAAVEPQPSQPGMRFASPTPPVASMLPFDTLNMIVDQMRDSQCLDADLRAARLQVQLLHNRGVREAEAMRTLLCRDWRATPEEVATFPDLERAVERILAGLQNGEHIVIFGDYDADGMTSCALMTQALRDAATRLPSHSSIDAPRIEPFLPTREDDGRGLNLQAVEALGAAGVSLIITTDCGTANVVEVARAGELGIDVIVTDHHPPHGERAPALALVNPACADQPGTSADLAGVGVAFRLAEALFARLELGEAESMACLTRLLDLVAIGTVGDVVPLTEQSWVLARAGLRQLRSAPRPGLRALLAVANVDPTSLTERDVSFALGPRLNAASRLGNPQAALDLLLCGDSSKAERLAVRLDALNRERRARVDTMLAEAQSQIAGCDRHSEGQEGRPIVVIGEDWPAGMLGLVASRLAEDYGVPAFALGRKGADYRGSGRAPVGYDLGALLEDRAAWFSHYGGHRLAAGFTIPAARLGDLRAYLTEVTTTPGTPPSASAVEHAEEVSSTEASTHEHDTRYIDCILPLSRATLANAAAVSALAPYGQQFGEPSFLCQGVRLLRAWRTGVEGHTLRLAVEEDGLSGRTEHVLYWPRQGGLADELRAALPTTAHFDLVYTIGSFRARNTGRTELSLRLISLHATEPPI